MRRRAASIWRRAGDPAGRVRQRLQAAEQLRAPALSGLLVIDLGACRDLPLAAQTRLADQAIAHGTLILCLTAKTEQQPSLGSLVAVRGHALRIAPGRAVSPAGCRRSRTSGAVRLDRRGVVSWTGRLC